MLPDRRCYIARVRLRNLLSVPHWKSRLLPWGAAAAVGAAAVLLAAVADAAQSALRRLMGVWPQWPSLLAPLRFFSIAWVTPMVTAALAAAISKLITPPLDQTLADRYAH